MSPPPFRDSVSLSGWLLADLLLGLAVLFFAANTVGTQAAAKPASSPSPTVTAQATATPRAERVATITRTPIPTSAPCQPTVALQKHELHVVAGPGGRAPGATQLHAAFASFGGSRAGLLLTFGHAAAPVVGENIAGQVNAALRVTLPALFGPETVMEAFHFLDGTGTGAVDFQIYLFATACH